MIKKLLLIVLTIVISATFLYPQVEQGDKEITFAASMTSLVGIENFSSTNINLFLSYGYFVSNKLQLGIGPSLTYSRTTSTFSSFDPELFAIVEEETVTEDTQFSGYVFINFNFSTASKTVPYFAAQWYQFDFDPESGKFTDASYVNIGFGIRNFFSEYAALNTSANYGFALSSATEGGIILITTGLSVFL
jgi:hypothetical protein